MKPLYVLPTEVLAQIFRPLGNGIIRLWLTGDQHLLHLLSQRNTVTSLKLLLVYGAMRTSRLPAMVNSLIRLTSLTINNLGQRLAHPARLWHALSSLTQLKELTLECKEAEEWLLDPNWPSTDFHSLFDAPDAPCEHQVLSSPASRLRPFAATFPHLELLSLKRARNVLEVEDLHHFPKSITNLSLLGHSQIKENCLPIIHIFPNIRSLHISVSTSAVLTGVLPSSITSLDFGYHPEFEIPSTFWGDCNIIHLAVNLSKSSFAFIPSSVETLRFSAFFPTTDYTQLDYRRFFNLKTLTFASYNSRQAIKAQLPSSVTSLVFANSNLSWSPMTGDSLIHLPPQLQKLHFYSIADASLPFVLQSIKLLAHLTSLKFRHSFTFWDTSHKYLSELPPTLKSLTLWHPLSDAASTKHDVSSSVPHLPRSLTKLCIAQCNLFIASSAIKSLPRDMRRLEMSIALVDDDSLLPSHVLDLPRGISQLKIAFVDCPPTSQLNTSLDSGKPSTLKSSSEAAWTLEMLANLPQGLNHAAFFDCPLTNWTTESLSLLPRSIRHLVLDSGIMSDSSFLGLPSGLNSLYCKGPSPSVSGKCFKLLPQNLVGLHLTETIYIEDKDFLDIPPSLKYLELATVIPTLTKDVINYWPSTLGHLEGGPHFLKVMHTSITSLERSKPLEYYNPSTNALLHKTDIAPFYDMLG